jgi:hypothetical protein
VNEKMNPFILSSMASSRCSIPKYSIEPPRYAEMISNPFKVTIIISSASAAQRLCERLVLFFTPVLFQPVMDVLGQVDTVGSAEMHAREALLVSKLVQGVFRYVQDSQQFLFRNDIVDFFHFHSFHVL